MAALGFTIRLPADRIAQRAQSAQPSAGEPDRPRLKRHEAQNEQ
jgi:hypothetical protein